MRMTNLEVVTYLNKLSSNFFNDDMKNKYLPVKLNFAIQKNLATLGQHNIGIDESRKTIGEHYGTLDGNHYIIDPDKIDEANQELQDLYNIEIELPILTVSLSSIEDLDLTMTQMDALMFMIEE